MSCSISWSYPTFGNGTFYLWPWGNNGGASAVEENALWPVPRNCRIQNLRIRIRTHTAGFTPSLVLRQNRADTMLRINMVSAALTGSDVSHSILLSPGDLISLALYGLSTMTAYVVSADFRPAS